MCVSVFKESRARLLFLLQVILGLIFYRLLFWKKGLSPLRSRKCPVKWVCTLDLDSPGLNASFPVSLAKLLILLYFSSVYKEGANK